MLTQSHNHTIIIHPRAVRTQYDRDFLFEYFGYKTLEKGYLVAIDGELVERPQHMFMRVALGIHGADLDRAFETYDLMSQKYFIHASPTLFNAGTPRPQLSSCFLLTMKEDSIEGIYDTLTLCASISKYAGGIGLSCHHIRATDSYVSGSNGVSNGLVPMLRVFNGNSQSSNDPAYHGPTHSYLLSHTHAHTHCHIHSHRHGALRGPGRRQAQGLLRHVPGALAR